MSIQKLEIKTAIKVQKPVHEVFDAVIDPAKMSNYFISKSSGRMEEGKELIWKFPEFDLEFPVQIGKLVNDQYISFSWKDMQDGTKTIVEMNFKAVGEGTFLTITEKERENNEKGIEWLKGNTQGWANFLACLKAWLEYGINLRKGAFD